MRTPSEAPPVGPDGAPARAEALAWALGASPGPAFAIGADGRMSFVNAAARERWKDAGEGAAATQLFPVEVQARFLDACATVLASGAGVPFEWGEVDAAGPRTWLHTTLSPLRDGDDVVGILCVSWDATALKRSEARLRRSEELMVDTQGVAHLGTWDWDVSEPHAVWSAELYRIYGLTPEEYTPSYEAYLTMVHPEDRQRVMDATDRVFHSHIPYSHDERIFRPDGSVRYLHTWAHPVRNEAGKLIRLVGVCQDITDQKLAEEAVRNANRELERRVAERTKTIENSMRDLEAFNVMASHDLRAPLAVIQGSCQFALETAAEPLPDMVEKTLERIQRSAKRMTTLVNDLLKLAHVGNTSLARVEVDVSALCEELIANLRAQSPDREVDVLIAPGLRCVADAGLIRAALDNLLGNAWKYTSQLPRARIEVDRAPSQHPNAIIVRDDGAGFDMSEADRLFAPFQRLRTAAKFDGMGVGLTTVHRIIERHGGRIWATSEPGSGATFFIDLPAP